MNSSYALEKLEQARQDDRRREQRSTQLIPLDPGSAGTNTSASVVYGLVMTICGIGLAALLVFLLS